MAVSWMRGAQTGAHNPAYLLGGEAVQPLGGPLGLLEGHTLRAGGGEAQLLLLGGVAPCRRLGRAGVDGGALRGGGAHDNTAVGRWAPWPGVQRQAPRTL